MKVKYLALSAAAAVIVPAAGLAAPVFADSPGQIESGTGVYLVKNLTQKIPYAASVKANACDELQYSARLHNPGYGQITNVIAAATVGAGSATTNTSNFNVTWSNGIGSGVSASANVTLNPAQSVSYENGSAELLDVDGNVIKNLPDSIMTNGGTNLGSLNGSTTEYVIFKAKVNCPTTPPVTPPATPSTPAAPTTPAPTTLVNTGAGSVVGIFAAAVAFGAVAYRVVLSRRLSRQ